jgi:magnesium-transporting ATPase (P-type)
LDRVRARLVVGGAAIGAAIFVSFLIGTETSHVAGQTMAFTTLVLGRLLFVFTVRGDGPFWRAGVNLRLFGAVALSAAIALVILIVPFVGEEFGVAGLSGGQWLAAVALALVPLIVPELCKALPRRSVRRTRLSPASVRS